MAPTEPQFKGWLGYDKESYKGNMKWADFPEGTVKPFEETDVDIEISHCGICGSDLHTLRSGWGETIYPVCVGHEIVGKAIRVGSQVKGIKVGDNVGVGAQSNSCLKPDCAFCSDSRENSCQDPLHLDTFDCKYPGTDYVMYGGYADYKRVNGHFAIKIPDSIPLHEAAPMLCGGVTLYSPLTMNGCGPGKKVGIVGIGGLGHFGVLFASALGADEVWAISRTAEKKADAMKMGAKKFIATSEDKDWASENAGKLDLIVSTVSSPKMPIAEYLQLLAPYGRFIQVGAPEDSIPGFNVFALIAKHCTLGGSCIGSPDQIRDMFKLVEEKKVKAWIEQRPMKEANQAIVDMDNGKARYRYTLVNENFGKH